MYYNGNSVAVPAPAEAPAISVYNNISFDCKNVDLYYGSFQALKGINLRIEKNQITALIGPSGCGKSTFLRSLNRMNDLIPSCRVEWEILLVGVDAYKDIDPIVLRRHVGMVFQQPNPFRPGETLSLQVWASRTEGVGGSAADTAAAASAVLMLMVLAFSIGARLISHYITKKTEGEHA